MKFVKLGTVCKLRNGYAFKSTNFTENGVPIIRISNISDNIVSPEKSVRTPYEKLFDNYKIINGDILIAMSGATTGKFGIYNSDEVAYQNQRVGCFKILDNSLINQTYLLQVLNTIKPIIEKKANGGAQPNISANAIEEIIIPLPSLTEQIQIAEILTQAENLITKRKESIALLDELLKSTFLDMFGDPVRNEKEWDKDTFDNLVDNDCPLTYGIVQPGEEFTNGVPVIRPVDLIKTYIDRTGLKLIDPEISDKFKRTLLQGKEILMCVRGTTGIISLASEELSGCNVTRGIVPIWFSNDYNKFFAFGLLKTKAINNEIQSLTYGATLQQINLSDLRKIKLINPPLDLQNQYAFIVEKVEGMIKNYQSSLIELENMYGVLSQKAFKGELFKERNSVFEVYEKYSKIENNINDIKTPVIGSLEPSKEVENPPVYQKKEIHIKDMTLDDYYGIPEEIITKYGSIENHHEDWEFLLKKIFYDNPIDLNHLQEIYDKITYEKGKYFIFEDWKNFIFKELSKSKSYLKQKYNTENKQLELLINEIKKA